jgi:hypothetical protein
MAAKERKYGEKPRENPEKKLYHAVGHIKPVWRVF